MLPHSLSINHLQYLHDVLMFKASTAYNSFLHLLSCNLCSVSPGGGLSWKKNQTNLHSSFILSQQQCCSDKLDYVTFNTFLLQAEDTAHTPTHAVAKTCTFTAEPTPCRKTHHDDNRTRMNGCVVVGATFVQ